MLIVTNADRRALAFCSSGARLWFARHHLDWTQFLLHGLPADAFEAIGDAFALEIIAQARKRVADGQ